MATPSAVSAFVTQAQAQALTFQNMVDALRWSMINSLVNNGGTVLVRQGKDGMELAQMSWGEAVDALAKLNTLAMSEAGMVVTGPGFLPQCSGRGYW